MKIEKKKMKDRINNAIELFCMIQPFSLEIMSNFLKKIGSLNRYIFNGNKGIAYINENVLFNNYKQYEGGDHVVDQNVSLEVIETFHSSLLLSNITNDEIISFYNDTTLLFNDIKLLISDDNLYNKLATELKLKRSSNNNLILAVIYIISLYSNIIAIKLNTHRKDMS